MTHLKEIAEKRRVGIGVQTLDRLKPEEYN